MAKKKPTNPGEHIYRYDFVVSIWKDYDNRLVRIVEKSEWGRNEHEARSLIVRSYLADGKFVRAIRLIGGPPHAHA